MRDGRESAQEKRAIDRLGRIFAPVGRLVFFFGIIAISFFSSSFSKAEPNAGPLLTRGNKARTRGHASSSAPGAAQREGASPPQATTTKKKESKATHAEKKEIHKESICLLF
ncbi:hypothetical protein [Pandoravirus japonicus]|uniref:Transmembrane protein n=1 Tax=Pandoravirus japonicus TaxID=2823154 RepID=A0A811BRV8_9VIRU|nr:hypothetical protein [Pandoravirus japonicus]